MKEGYIVNKKVVTLLLLFLISIGMIFFLFKVPKEDKLKGLWDIDGNTMYEFDGKGNGKLIISSNEYNFTYNLDNNNLFIDFEQKESKDSRYIVNIKQEELVLNNMDEQHLIHTLKRVTK